MVGRERWAYLDAPELLQQLLDFADDRVHRVTFEIPAMHCIACVWLLENLFRLHPGVGRSLVNFAQRQVTITYARDRLSLSELVALLAAIGYEPQLNFGTLEKGRGRPAQRRLHLQVGVAGFGFGNIMLFSLPAYLGFDTVSGPMFRALFGGLSLLLALPVLVYSAADYWRSAWAALRQRWITLDIPIVLGLAALYGQSAYEILAGRGEGYLDSLAGLVFFLLCGRIFQQKTFDRLSFDRDYRGFFPLAVVRRTDRGEETVALSQLAVGDRLVLRNGEVIPADATHLSGPACIDYSFVTGEAEPVSRQPGDRLYAGGQQIGGAIEVETVKPVSQSYLTALWGHEAFRKRPSDDLNQLTNRYGRRFTLVVIAVAAGAAVFWLAVGDPARAVKCFTSVLIVACPCALALAVPLTLGTAQRLLARVGIFVKHTLVLERLARVTTVILDKTGTLTSTKAVRVTFHGTPLAPVERGWLRALTRSSAHPYAVRIGESLESQAAAGGVRSFRETPGRGLAGEMDGHVVRLGSAAWLAEEGIALPPGEFREGSVVHLALEGRYRGTFELVSALRPEAERLGRALRSRYEVALVSGDHGRERERFQRVFGGDVPMHFEQSPLDKLQHVRRLQEAGRTVMMVGDGLNDAGALRQSDVGVAVIEQTGAFSPASDVILEAAQVRHLGDLLEVARRAVSAVQIGFGISAVYNAVGISVAAAGWLSPLLCAVLMPLSSVSVVLFGCGAARAAAGRTAWGDPDRRVGGREAGPNPGRSRAWVSS
jgi:Cu+-exporting ATPase